MALQWAIVPPLSAQKKQQGEAMEIESSMEQYALFIENIEEYAIFMMDVDRQTTSWNPGVEKVLGYGEDQFLGQTADIIFVPEDRAAGAPDDEMQIALLRGEARDERWHLRKDGSRFWGMGMMTALYTPEKELRGFAKILRDMTERRQAEEALQAREAQLQVLNAQLEAVNQDLEARVRERTEKLRELAAQLTLSEYQERRRIARILHDHLQQLLYSLQFLNSRLRQSVEESLMALLAQVDQILMEAINTARTLSVELSPPILELDGLASALSWLAAQMQERHGLQVTVEIEDESGKVEQHVQDLIFQSVRELLFNVVKHAGADAATVILKQTQDEQIVIVKDEGRGFDAGSHPNNGTGLHSIRSRISLFGGHIDVQSKPDEGARVILVLPTQPSA
jgi:PAS domain S-box-containing protein